MAAHCRCTEEYNYAAFLRLIIDDRKQLTRVRRNRMAIDVKEAVDVAREATEERPLDRFLDRLAERIGGRASVKAVFGEPIERGDLTIVPVARVRWGFGGGSGTSGGDAEAAGSGGGGGVAADPAGYIEIRAGEARFRPIVPPYPSPGFLLAAGLTAAIVIRALARLASRSVGRGT
jgi:hypothetical protein